MAVPSRARIAAVPSASWTMKTKAKPRLRSTRATGPCRENKRSKSATLLSYSKLPTKMARVSGGGCCEAAAGREVDRGAEADRPDAAGGEGSAAKAERSGCMARWCGGEDAAFWMEGGAGGGGRGERVRQGEGLKEAGGGAACSSLKKQSSDRTGLVRGARRLGALLIEREAGNGAVQLCRCW